MINIVVVDLLSGTGVLAINLAGVATAGAVVGGAGLVIGILLGIAAKIFHVEVDEKEGIVRELLPGNNCGGCGYPGCDGLAKAIAEGKAAVNACPVANKETHAKIGEVMGKTAEVLDRKIAFVKCKGTSDKTNRKYDYQGIKDCKKLASVPGNGEKVCTYSCMGYGTCVRACAFDAIHIIDGVAIVDKEKCVACGKCIEVCPNELIELVPVHSEMKVACNSNEKGRDVTAGCSVGCIACMICVKVCEYDAVKVTNNLALIDYSKCTHCGKCAEKCPKHVITFT